jgi:hypothetical protein
MIARIAFALVLASQVAVAEPEVDKLPVIATVAHGRTRVVVRGELAKPQQAQARQLVEQVIADVQRRFTQPAEQADPAITLCVLASEARYRAVAGEFGPIPSDWGFYMPDKRIAIANFGQSIGNLRHELAHPLVGDDFPGIPTWLDEGIGALYGTAVWKRDHFEFAVNYRLRDLAKDELPTVRELAESREADVHGEHAGLWYAYARYVLLYLDRKGELGDVYRGMRAASGDLAKQRALLEGHVDDAAFRAWAKRLRY